MTKICHQNPHKSFTMSYNYNYENTINAINQLAREHQSRASVAEIYDNIISEGDGTYHDEYAETEIDAYLSDNTIEQNMAIIEANGSDFNAIAAHIEMRGENMLDMRNERMFTQQLASTFTILAIRDYDVNFEPTEEKQIEYGVDVSIDTTCSICLTDSSESDDRNSEWARTIQCNHYFHKACIDLWARNCPNCRSEI